MLVSKLRRALSGDLSAFGGPATDGETAARLRAEQVAGVIRHTRGIMIANACNALVFVAAEAHSGDARRAVLWAVPIIATVVFIIVRQSRDRPQRATVSERTVRRAVLYALILGGLWSTLPLLFFKGAAPGVQLVIACLCSGMLAGGAFGLGAIPIAAVAFTGPIFVASALAIARSGETTAVLVAALLVVYALVLLRAVFIYAIDNANRFVAQVEAERQVRHDPLTRLPNRVGFGESLTEAFTRLSRDQQPFVLLRLDMDSFKAVNDRLGHSVGDDILVQAADRLRLCARDGDALGRLGGDEFAVIASGIARPEEGVAVAQHIIEAFEAPFRIDGQEVASSVSIGLAIAPIDGDSQRNLLRSADIALYQAKSARGGSYRFFDASDHELARERRLLEHDLSNALHRGELRLVYQPIAGLADGRIVGFEALVRWNHPTRGLVAPGDFIRVAESTGLIRAIGQWVVEEAARTAARWPERIRISVNFSAVQFREPTLSSRVMAAIAASGLAPSRFEVEVTESVLLADDETACAVLDALSRQGLSVALDDFGTGYSSLSYVRRLPLQRIKIDRSFVQDLTSDQHSASIVKSVIALAADLGIDTTAEGVETAEQLAFLRALHCGEAQGYLIGRPMEADEATAMIGRPLPVLDEALAASHGKA